MEYIEHIEIRVFYWFNSFAFVSSFIDRFIAFQASYFGWIMLVAFFLFLIIPLFKKYRHLARLHSELFIFALTVSLFARFVIKEIITLFYDRLRPFESILYVKQLILVSGGDSFPSGHAIFFFALAMAIAFYYPRISIFFFIGAFSISVARISAGVHWPLDILAGTILGILISVVFHHFFLLWKKKRQILRHRMS